MKQLRYLIYYLTKAIIGKKNASMQYLKPYLKDVEKNLKNYDVLNDCHSNKVWTMWLQDEIPEIVEVCLKTIKKIYPETIIITEKNLQNFVEVPKHIQSKYKNKQISMPHYSDYIRCLLLEKYGGLWLDASLYMLDKVPEFITKQEFFILTEPTQKAISNFFIYSKSNNYIIKAMRIFLEQYWQKERKAINYFFFHHFFMLLCKKNKNCKQYFKQMKHWTNAQIRYFVDHPQTNFNQNLWEYLKITSFMYKINRKDLNAMNNPNGFYHYILTHNN